LFELDLVKSEFELHGLRIDTLAFDNESKAFVIIEYKKDRNFSVVDQGMAYLNLMLNKKLILY
jgi:RecB family endonuclease NucS